MRGNGRKGGNGEENIPISRVKNWNIVKSAYGNMNSTKENCFINVPLADIVYVQ